MRHMPSVMQFGAFSLISPDGSHRIPDALWPELAAAVVLEPEPDVLAEWVRQLELKLGVNPAHRLAIETSAAEVRAFIAAEQSQKGLRSTDDGLKVQLPDAERGRSAFDLKRLDVLNARLAKPYKARGGKSADELKAEDVARRAALETRGRDAPPSEDRSGLARILDHDPLASLPWLTKDQFEAGRTLRGFYANQGGDIACAEITGMPSGGHDHERFVANRAERAMETAKIQWVTSAILIGQFRNRRGELCRVETHARFKAEGVQPSVALSVLRDVCAYNKTLTSLGAGRIYDRHRQALALALDVTHEVLGT